MKVYLIHVKNGTMIHFNVNVKNRLIGVLVKKVTCGILAHMISSVIKSVK